MAVSVLKIHFRSIPSKDISCRDLKNFDNEKFMCTLQLTLYDQNHENNVEDLEFFKYIVCQDVLNTHVSGKKKCIHGDGKSFMTKSLPKTVIQ